MKKNSEIHLKLETDLFERIKKQAIEEGITISEVCRRRIKENSQLTRLEFLIGDLNKRLNSIKF
jgi:hypothetical protein